MKILKDHSTEHQKERFYVTFEGAFDGTLKGGFHQAFLLTAAMCAMSKKKSLCR